MRKVPDLRLNEVTGDLRRDSEEAAIADHRDLKNLPMMFSDELQMCDERSEVIPSRKRRGIDHYSVQFTVGFDVRIDLLRQFLEIGRFKSILGAENHNPFRSV